MMDRYLTCCDGQNAAPTVDRHTSTPGEGRDFVYVYRHRL